MQALQADYSKQKQEICASFTAAKADMDVMMTAGREHFSTSGSAVQLAFETAKAEAQEGDSEEYNVLKLSLEAQVHGSPMSGTIPEEQQALLHPDESQEWHRYSIYITFQVATSLGIGSLTGSMSLLCTGIRGQEAPR